MRLPFAAVAVLIGLLAGCSGEKTHRKAEAKIEGVTTHKKAVRPWTTAKATQPTAKATAPTPVKSNVPEQVIKQLNENRARLGLGPLKLDPTLMRVAQEHAEFLAKEKNVNADPEAKKLFQRMQGSGYAFANASNQAWATRDPATPETVTGFLKQPQMAAGLATAVDVGIGIAPGTDGNTYIVVVHAIPAKKM